MASKSMVTSSLPSSSQPPTNWCCAASVAYNHTHFAQVTKLLLTPVPTFNNMSSET